MARSDSFAERQHGQIGMRQYDQGAKPQQGRREQQAYTKRACQRESRVLSILPRRTGARSEAHGPGRIEAEHHFLLRPQVGKLPGLGQGNAKFTAGPRLLQQDG